MKLTIKEIAEMAGVHRATVDKVIHNRVGVSDEVRQRIQQIIKEVGYTPNPAGRVLQRQGRTYRIAAVLTQVDALPFLQRGIKTGVARQVGFDVEISYFTTSFQDADGQLAILNQAIEQTFDGIIITPIHSRRIRAAIDRAVDAGIPVITCNSDIDGTKRKCFVGMDGSRASRVAGRLMGQFLNGQGEIAIISSAIAEENNNYYVTMREQGFGSFVQKNFPQMEIVERIESFEDPHITYQKTAELLQNHPALRGIYITCGGVAEVGRALRESGRQREIRVVSFEDYPEILELIRADVIDCTLASDLERQGMLPVQLLMDYLVFGRKPTQDQIFTDTQILVKESIFD